MKGLVVVYLPYLLSLLMIVSAWLAGNKSSLAWSLGLANQALWLVWICASESWGLLWGNAALAVMFARNWMKWRMA
ncbi:MAG: hypothetical protein LCH90_23190 [Proteobacteria bacterium]|nr:hypothetical protein [Pseudomonadota bacterium]